MLTKVLGTMMLYKAAYLYQPIGKYFVFIGYINKTSEGFMFIPGKFMLLKTLENAVPM